MNYYAVLEATNLLMARNNWVLKRCRRRYDGPPRYVVYDQHKKPVLTEEAHGLRQLGHTLPELLKCFCDYPDVAVADEAKELLRQCERDIAE